MRKFDVSRDTDLSIAAQLEVHFPKLDKMCLNEMKDLLTGILDNKKTIVDRTRNKWKLAIGKQKHTFCMMRLISNLYLAAANLKTS